MEKYYHLLGLHIDQVEDYFKSKNVNYTKTIVQGRKDKDKLTIPRVIKISDTNDGVEILITYFSDSLK